MKVTNNLDLAKYEIQNAVAQNLASAPSTPKEGQFYYNTADKVLYFWNGTVWKDTGLTGAEIKSLYEAEADTNALTDALLSKLNAIEAGATGDQTDAEIRAAVEAATDSNVFTDADHSKLDAIEASADVTDATNVDAAGAVMNTDSTTAAMSFVVDEDTMVSDLATKVPTQQSVKAYVDTEVASAVTNGMKYKGDYNAATNTPDLDTTPIATEIGDTYTVTAAGNFFTIAVEVGDSIIAKQNTATLETHWTVVQANLTAASIKTQYESNADTNAVTDAEKTVLGNTSGTNTGDEPSASTTVVGVVELATATEAKAKSSNTLALTPLSVADFPIKKIATLTGNDVTAAFTINHALGTSDVMVQVREAASPFAVVLADVEIDDTNNVGINFGVAPATGTDYKVVIIG